MAFYPSVHPGDPFKPNAALSNDVRRLINGHNAFSAGSAQSDYFGPVRIHCWNSGSRPIQPGIFCSLDSAAPFHDSIVPVTIDDTSSSYTILIAVSQIEPGQVGECSVRGIFCVPVADTAGSGKFAAPVIGSDFVRMDYISGFPVLLLAPDKSKALIELSSIMPQQYRGSFPVTINDDQTLKVGSGYLSRNGKISLVSGADRIQPQSGTLCVTSKISGDSWTTPTFGFAKVDSTSYPIAQISVISNDSIDIRQFPISVAVILETQTCPLIKKS